MMKSVIVIGGGIAGLAAASELVHHGIAVTLLEAKERLGGRIYTTQFSGMPVELGAEFVHGESPPLIQALRATHIATSPVSDKNQVFRQRRLEPADIWKIAGDTLQQVEEDEPDRSCEEFLHTVPEPAASLTRHFIEGFDAADPRRISVQARAWADRSSDAMNGSTQLRVDPGYGALVGFLADDFLKHRGRIQKGAVVRRVSWQPGAVEVLAVLNGRTESFSAAAVVVALPLGVLKARTVGFHPALPPLLDEAIQKMEFGNVVKSIFLFRSIFWEDFGFVHAFDELLPTWWNHPHRPILTGWAGGPKADALLHLAGDQLAELGLSILAKIFPAKSATLRRELIGFHYWNWANDPHIQGAYSYIPVNGRHLPVEMSRPVSSTLFFAGEALALDGQTGTVFTALNSGIRAAKAILNSR